MEPNVENQPSNGPILASARTSLTLNDNQPHSVTLGASRKSSNDLMALEQQQQSSSSEPAPPPPPPPAPRASVSAPVSKRSLASIFRLSTKPGHIEKEEKKEEKKEDKKEEKEEKEERKRSQSQTKEKEKDKDAKDSKSRSLSGNTPKAEEKQVEDKQQTTSPRSNSTSSSPPPDTSTSSNSSTGSSSKSKKLTAYYAIPVHVANTSPRTLRRGTAARRSVCSSLYYHLLLNNSFTCFLCPLYNFLYIFIVYFYIIYF